MTNIILTSLLTAVFVGPITAWVALLRYRSEKWWERRATAYMSIIEALYDIEAARRASFNTIALEMKLGDKRKEEIFSNAHRAELELEKQASLGQLFVSGEAEHWLGRYFVESQQASWYGDPVSELEGQAEVAEVIRQKIIAEAQRDLGVSFRPTQTLRSWWRRRFPGTD